MGRILQWPVEKVSVTIMTLINLLDNVMNRKLYIWSQLPHDDFLGLITHLGSVLVLYWLIVSSTRLLENWSMSELQADVSDAYQAVMKVLILWWLK